MVVAEDTGDIALDTGFPVTAVRVASLALLAATAGRRSVAVDGAARAADTLAFAGAARTLVAAAATFFFNLVFDTRAGFLATGFALLGEAFFFGAALRAGAFFKGFDFFFLAAIAPTPSEIRSDFLPERDYLRNQAYECCLISGAGLRSSLR